MARDAGGDGNLTAMNDCAVLPTSIDFGVSTSMEPIKGVQLVAFSFLPCQERQLARATMVAAEQLGAACRGSNRGGCGAVTLQSELFTGMSHCEPSGSETNLLFQKRAGSLQAELTADAWLPLPTAAALCTAMPGVAQHCCAAAPDSRCAPSHPHSRLHVCRRTCAKRPLPRPSAAAHAHEQPIP